MFDMTMTIRKALNEKISPGMPFDLQCQMPKHLEDDAAPIHYARGYCSLATFIASDCDKSTSIYRRFDRLSARNLLYIQSELFELEAQQDELDAEDLRGILEDKRSARDWRILKQKASAANNVREKETLKVVREIREKIKEYSRASPHWAIMRESTNGVKERLFCWSAP